VELEADMDVSIVGAGAIAMGYAAFLLEKGHAPSIWSPSGSRATALMDGEPLVVAGAIEGRFYPKVCIRAEEVAENDVIIFALPAYGHRAVIDRLLPFIEPHHTVIISSHLSFAALYMARKLAERRIRIPIAVWNTTVLTCKARTSTDIKVGAIRAKVDMATVPVSFAPEVHALCVDLFGDRFAAKDDILTIDLSNLNPQSHMGIALCNLTRIERGEAWGQRANITPTVGRLLEALDLERRSIASAFGKSVRSISEHYELSFGISGKSVAEISLELAGRGQEIAGPLDINTRYVLEDVPFGLVPTLYLARMSGEPAPLHRSGLEILSACYGRNFAADNDLLTDLGEVDRDTLMTLIVDGRS
jgi:opine dehydrogenase